MVTTVQKTVSGGAIDEVFDAYCNVRKHTLLLIDGLTAEDMVAQSMPDASPTKWHLAHTTWFFETFILQQYSNNFSWFKKEYCHLFNSYYESVGSRHARPQRGLLTRPSLEEVMLYRHSIDRAMEALLLQGDLPEEAQQEITYLTTVGLHHEMQHQELMMTDVLHLLWHNPLFPQVKSSLGGRAAQLQSAEIQSESKLNMIARDAGLYTVGAQPGKQPETFSYDCEGPQHQVYLQSFAVADRLVSNGEWKAFMLDKGYQNSLLWLSDGWTKKQKEGWSQPLYWLEQDGNWFQYGLDGLQLVNDAAPVCHISFYEAEAYARWAGKRLPKEHEWEVVARDYDITGNFLESGQWRPSVASNQPQFHGNVWEWTQSPYSPYPGFQPEMGALGEYNGKFMSNQYVLRGGSCVTPAMQMRYTYRNFFYPHHRWQYTGLRLAEDR